MITSCRCIAATAALTLTSPLVFGAQAPRAQPLMATVITVAPIYIQPKVLPTPLRTAAVGTRLEVLDEQGDWVQVRFGDPLLGPRVGWIEGRLLRIERPELQPLDLSVDPAREREQPAAVGRREQPAAVAQPDHVDPDDFERGWIDVNIGVAFAAEKSYTIRAELPLFQERATFGGDYSFPTGADFDFGGGVMITPAFGVGISISGTAHQDTAMVRATIPHPFRFNVLASDSAETPDKLTKAEGAVHIQAMFSSMLSDRARVRFFAGPSYFRVMQDTLDDIRYNQVFQILGGNQITITSAPFSESEGTAWGFHVGGDVSWFFTRVVGIGGVARFSRATVDIIDLLGTVVENKAGGFQAAGGLRLKF